MSILTTDVSHVPQVNESQGERDARMQWFRDAKFGMFIHWGPCSVGAREIGWGRNAHRPMDINVPQPSDEPMDEEYDNYYKVFNPTKYDPDAWARFAKASGMRYMVLITKHHDGFSMWDTKLSDYNIMASAYGRDIVGPFVKACHDHGLKAGLYYSTRDWYHPDYLVGDNVAYDEWYRAQIEELLTNYGRIDMMWYDHVGGRDWGKWRFDELFAMMYRHQPELLVNNRAARFCGPATPEDRGPETPEVKQMCEGDFYTPEGRIGAMDIEQDWESCIHVGQGWSYRGEDGFKGPENCIRMLVSCTTGGGNLLLNFGPRPDGAFAEGEAKVARAMGKWLNRYGDAVYGTRGGPYKNGSWGGSCHKDDKLYLHILNWTEGPLDLDTLPHEVLAARTLDDNPVTVSQTADVLRIEVALEYRTTPVTVIELTLDRPVPDGAIYGEAHQIPRDLSEYGEVISRDATLSMCGSSQWDTPENHHRLFADDPDHLAYSFHTERMHEPWAIVDLGSVHEVRGVLLENWTDQRVGPVALAVSEDGDAWHQVRVFDVWDAKWFVEVTRFHAGIEAIGRPVRYLKLHVKSEGDTHLFLRQLTVYGE